MYETNTGKERSKDKHLPFNHKDQWFLKHLH